MEFMKEFKITEKSIRKDRPVEYLAIPPFPQNMLLSLTSLCNHKCIMCTHSIFTPRTKSMPLEKAKNILKQARELGVCEVGFHSMGEPFLSKDLEAVVLEAKNLGYEYIYFTTNGSLATEERIKKLFQNGLNSIKFSINAGNAETYKRVHGKNDFQKVIDNIIAANKIRKELRVDVSIFVSFAETQINKGQTEDLLSILKNSIDYLYSIPSFNQGGNMSQKIEDKTINKNNMSRCPRPFNCFNVTPEGYLNACCMDLHNYLAYADLNRTTLKEAWSNSDIQILRNQHINRTLPKNSLCYNCLHNTNNKVEHISQEFA